MTGARPSQESGWAVIIPVKHLASAKSRMTDAGIASLQDLALAFFQDTATAVLSCDVVEQVIVATSDPVVSQWAIASGCEIVDDSASPGINAAAHQAAVIGAGDRSVAVVVSDLPCLTSAALESVLRAADGHSAAVLGDLEGTGTTMWMHTPPVPLPQFGVNSRARHVESGALDLVTWRDDPGWLAARRDIDTPEDLVAAIGLGLGPHTAAALLAVQ